ncbi:MAG: hypothetical protein KKG94_01965 [Nanoarchaeota archaeon]|nr:hypothetical protein [Candidatus Woesearchaeota archaeon]MBU4116488.1 hypothetical protein [Nanoarchaeota archaeon]
MEEKENKYLKEFEELKKDAINTNRRKAYLGGRKDNCKCKTYSMNSYVIEDSCPLPDVEDVLKHYDHLKPNQKLELQGHADRWLRSDKMIDLVKGALVYDKMGKFNSFAQKMVIKGLKKQENLTDSWSQYDLKKLEKIFNKNCKSNLGQLETKVAAAIALAGVVSGLIFLSPNLTGNVIGNLSNSSSNIIGGVLFLIGLVGAFFSIRGR